MYTLVTLDSVYNFKTDNWYLFTQVILFDDQTNKEQITEKNFLREQILLKSFTKYKNPQFYLQVLDAVSKFFNHPVRQVKIFLKFPSGKKPFLYFFQKVKNSPFECFMVFTTLCTVVTKKESQRDADTAEIPYL